MIIASLRVRMMIFILAPTLLIGLMLSIFFVASRYQALQEDLVNAGINIIEPLAAASEYGMNAQNYDSVRRLVNLLHRRHSNNVRVISIYNAQNQLFATSNYNHNPKLLQLAPDAPFPREMSISQQGNALVLRTPIMAEEQPNDNISNLQSKSRTPLGYIAIELDLNAVKLEQYKEIFIAGLMLLLCMLIATLFAYRFMRDITGPIANMVSTVDRIRRGQLDSRVEGVMLGELQMLKKGINSMAKSLAAYHEEMQHNVDQATGDLRETLEQMEIQNIELDLAKKRAQEAARIKSEFLTNMSHELRTPLNAVLGFTRQTLKTELTFIQNDYLQTIERAANNLLIIINDVLDFSKLEAGKLLLEHIPFSLHDTLDEVVMLLAHTAHEKNLELTLDIDPDVPEQIIGDALRLQQVVTNLLGNAIKFTENGNIDIKVALRSQLHQHPALEIQIQDTGIGISETQQATLFQAFRQADASISRRHGGTGLGLVITQKLVKEMGGNIFFHSTLNKGSTFGFHIKLETNDALPSGCPELTHLKGKRLGYVEANPAAAQAALNMLSTTPLEVTHALTLAQLPAQHYDILIIGIPVTLHASLARHQDKLAKAITLADKVILVLPSQSQLDAELFQTLGAQGTLIKPLSAARLFPLLLAKKTQPTLAPPEKKRLPLTIMAVDDNPANLKLIGALLQELVEKTLLCHSGEEAIAVARAQVLDMILMDIQMPNMDGILASQLIRQIPHHQQTPIVAVTAHVVSGEPEHFLQSGMDDYLAKPIDEAMLSRLLAQLIPATEAAVNPQTNLSLDWPLALQQAANKPELARDLLQMLVDFLDEVEQRVNALLAGESDELMLDLIHKLHGSSTYSGVPRLKALCATLEQQLRNQVPVMSLEPEWLELLDEIVLVKQAAVPYLHDPAADTAG